MLNLSFSSDSAPHWFISDALKFVNIKGTVLDPCSGEGAVSQRLSYLNKVQAVFTNDWSEGFDCNFHLDATNPSSWEEFPIVDWVVSHPPFGRSMNSIVELAYAHARVGCLFFLPLSFLEPCKIRVQILQELTPAVVLSYPRYSFRNTKGGSDVRSLAAFAWIKEFEQAGLSRIEFRSPKDIEGYHRTALTAPKEADVVELIKKTEDKPQDELFFSEDDWRMRAITEYRLRSSW